MTIHIHKCLHHHMVWFLGQSCEGPGSMILWVSSTPDILWVNNSNPVLLHMYIRYMEVSNLASHTASGVYFKKLSPNIALHTD